MKWVEFGTWLFEKKKALYDLKDKNMKRIRIFKQKSIENYMR